MASSQIEQLRASFDKMSTAQKKQFIDNLKKQLQNSKSTEHLKFLQECVSKYNASVNGGSVASAQTPTASASSSATAKSKQKNPLMGAVIFLSIIVVALLIGGGAFIVSTLNNSNKTGDSGGNNSDNSSVSDNVKNDNEKIIGEWAEMDGNKPKKVSGIDIKWSEEYKNSSDARINGKKDFIESNSETFVFKRDGSYKRIIPALTATGFIDPDRVYEEGTYELKGTQLTLYPDSSKEETYEIKIEDGTLYLDERPYR